MNFIIQPMEAVLRFFNGYINNWGWSIVLLTLAIKIVLFPLSIKQIQSMDKMKKIQPKLKEIQDKYKDKPEEFQRRTMELYKKENVNPLSGCLPMLIQLPILWAIYALLTNSAIAKTIKNSIFLGLKLGDTHNLIIAVISGVTTFLQQKAASPTMTADSNQQQVFLYFMPIFFGFITWTVSNGVGLYWVASNIIGIAQQYLIYEYFVVKEHIQKDEEPDETVKKPATAKKK